MELTTEIVTIAKIIASGRALHSIRHGGAVFTLIRSDSDMAREIIAKVLRPQAENEERFAKTFEPDGVRTPSSDLFRSLSDLEFRYHFIKADKKTQGEINASIQASQTPEKVEIFDTIINSLINEMWAEPAPGSICEKCERKGARWDIGYATESVKKATDQILELIQPQVAELRNQLNELSKKLDGREADLIQAKKEERERLGLYENELGFCEISNHVPWQALKEAQ